MAFEDKTLTCSSCGMQFVFTSGEQEFFASKSYTNEPKRCPTCRAQRRTERRSGGDDYRAPRQMYPAVCAQCGKETEVPFEPRQGRPVYCSDCYSKVRSSSGESSGSYR